MRVAWPEGWERDFTWRERLHCRLFVWHAVHQLWDALPYWGWRRQEAHSDLQDRWITAWFKVDRKRGLALAFEVLGYEHGRFLYRLSKGTVTFVSEEECPR